MLARLFGLAGLAAGVLVLIALASPAGALSERERADRLFDVAARCALLLKGVDPDPDEGRRVAADLLVRLEGEVGDPRPVWDGLRDLNPQCPAILNRPAVPTESTAERSPEPTSTGGQVDAPAALTGVPAAATQVQAVGSPEVVAEASVGNTPPESPPPVPSPAAPIEPPVAQPAAPAEPAPATPPVSASLAPPVAVEAPPAAAPPAAAPVPPVRPKLTQPAEATRAEPRPAAALTVVNGREVAATVVTVRAEAKTVRHAEPLASHARAVLKLPKLKGCVVTVEATFEGGDASEVGDIDLCKVKLVRLTD
jgi:hypothetical protein